jgi:hypothetical protein
MITVVALLAFVLVSGLILAFMEYEDEETGAAESSLAVPASATFATGNESEFEVLFDWWRGEWNAATIYIDRATFRFYIRYTTQGFGVEAMRMFIRGDFVNVNTGNIYRLVVHSGLTASQWDIAGNYWSSHAVVRPFQILNFSNFTLNGENYRFIYGNKYDVGMSYMDFTVQSPTHFASPQFSGIYLTEYFVPPLGYYLYGVFWDAGFNDPYLFYMADAEIIEGLHPLFLPKEPDERSPFSITVYAVFADGTGKVERPGYDFGLDDIFDPDPDWKWEIPTDFEKRAYYFLDGTPLDLYALDFLGLRWNKNEDYRRLFGDLRHYIDGILYELSVYYEWYYGEQVFEFGAPMPAKNIELFVVLTPLYKTVTVNYSVLGSQSTGRYSFLPETFISPLDKDIFGKTFLGSIENYLNSDYSVTFHSGGYFYIPFFMPDNDLIIWCVISIHTRVTVWYSILGETVVETYYFALGSEIDYFSIDEFGKVFLDPVRNYLFSKDFEVSIFRDFSSVDLPLTVPPFDFTLRVMVFDDKEAPHVAVTYHVLDQNGIFRKIFDFELGEVIDEETILAPVSEYLDNPMYFVEVNTILPRTMPALTLNISVVVGLQDIYTVTVHFEILRDFFTHTYEYYANSFVGGVIVFSHFDEGAKYEDLRGKGSLAVEWPPYFFMHGNTWRDFIMPSFDIVLWVTFVPHADGGNDGGHNDSGNGGNIGGGGDGDKVEGSGRLGFSWPPRWSNFLNALRRLGWWLLMIFIIFLLIIFAPLIIGLIRRIISIFK